MFYRLGKIAAHFRWLIVGLWMVVVAVALPFAPQVSQVLQASGFTSPSGQSQQALNLLKQRLHLNTNIVQIIFTSQRYSADEPQFVTESQQALVGLQHWPTVAQIVSFTDNPRQISTNRHAAYVDVTINGNPNDVSGYLPELQQRLRRVPDLKMSIGGVAVFSQDIQMVSEHDLQRAELLAFPFAVIVLLFVFRSAIAAILPTLIGGCAVVSALALVFALGHVTPLSIFVLNITTLSGLGLGVDYSLFIVSRFREELARGCSVEEAVTLTVATAGRAVAFSGLTVSIGLFGLTLFHINMLPSIGLSGMVVVVLSVLAAVTLLPALLAILGQKINALPVRFPTFWRKDKREQIAVQSGFWYRLSNFVMRYPVRVLVPVLLLLLTFGLPFLGVRFSAPDASILPKSVPSHTAYDLITQQFDANETTPITLAVQTTGNVLTPANIRALYHYVQRIEANASVRRVDSIVSADPRFTLDQYELLYTHPQLITDPYLANLLTSTVSDNTLSLQVISKYGSIDPRSQALVEAIRNTNPGNGIKVLVTGDTAVDIDYVNSLYGDFPFALLMIAMTTYIVLLLVFRSVVLPLKAIIMNTLSILASYGALVVIFQDGFLHQLLNFTPLGFVEASSPILLFCTLFGLSMDYEVFLLSRIQEAFWHTGDNTKAVALGLQRSGGIITSAALIVVVVALCFATADVILVKALSLGMALAVVIDATLVRGLLVPATMRLLGNWNWWLPFADKQRPSSVPPEQTETQEALPADIPSDVLTEEMASAD